VQYFGGKTWGGAVYNNWLWKDLYVPAEGRLERISYFVALFRIALIYMFGTQIFTALAPVLAQSIGVPITGNPFMALGYGALAAQLLIAWPAWSIFRRRLNDARPDLRAKLVNWSFAFPIFLIALLGVMVAGAAGFELPISAELHSRMRLMFFVMLFGAGLVPGGDAVPDAAAGKIRAREDIDRQVMLQTLAAQTGKPVEVETRQRAAPRPPRAAFPMSDPASALAGSSAAPAVERTRTLPQQGRVKPGWFS
jgi:uncharacterized membrane protein YhaH (DUF805 family)